MRPGPLLGGNAILREYVVDRTNRIVPVVREARMTAEVTRLPARKKSSRKPAGRKPSKALGSRFIQEQLQAVAAIEEAAEALELWRDGSGVGSAMMVELKDTRRELEALAQNSDTVIDFATFHRIADRLIAMTESVAALVEDAVSAETANDCDEID